MGLQSQLISKTLTGLYNGVSQQPPSLRLDSQCELQENILSQLVDGIVRRPNAEYVGTLSSNADANSKFHKINRDISERYEVIFTGDPAEPLEIYTLDGTKCSVSYEAGTDNYLIYEGDAVTQINPKTDLQAVTVADHTIIANSKISPEMMPSSVSIPDPKGLAYVKYGYPEVTYTVKVYESGGEVGSATYTTPAPTNNGVTTSPTDDIATELKNGLNSSLGSGYTVTTLGSVIVITHSSTPFTIQTEDSYGNQALIPIVGAVQKFSELPPTAPEGMTLKVEGDDGNNYDNFFVKFVDDTDGSGVWQESHALRDSDGNPIKNSLNPATLPHRLIRTGYNTFEFKTIEWEPRKVGNEDSAPNPSFVGQYINDIFFYKNRLGILSGENVVMSRASEYFDFYPSTATEVIDTDPIDVAAASKQVNKLKKAIAFANQLLIFSDQKQFISGGAGTLIPQTFALDTSTYYQTDTNVQPVGAGQNVFFVVPAGDYSTIREYYVQTDTKLNNADDVTAHVPRYLPKNIVKLETATARDMLFAISSETPNTLYVYNYYWDGNEKAQSAWSKWLFEEQVLDITVVDNYLYLLMDTGTEVTLQRIELENSPKGDLEFPVHLDKLVELTGTYDSGEDKTTWTLPYSDPSENFVFVRSDDGNEILGVTRQTGTDTFEAYGDYSDTTAYVGKNYTSKYRFSKFYVKGRDNLAQLNGKFQIRTLTMTFEDTGIFTLKVQTDDGRSSEKTFTSAQIGTSKLGSPAILSGEFRFVIFTNSMKSNIDIISESYLPFKFQTASYEGFWTSRSVGV